MTVDFHFGRGSTIHDSRSENKFIIQMYCFVLFVYIKQGGLNFTAAPLSPRDLRQT